MGGGLTVAEQRYPTARHAWEVLLFKDVAGNDAFGLIDNCTGQIVKRVEGKGTRHERVDLLSDTFP